MKPIRLDVGRPIWDRFFSVAPLVIVGSREPNGTYDLASKHIAMPLGWQNHYAFVCSPHHATYRNIQRAVAKFSARPTGGRVALTVGKHRKVATAPRLLTQSTTSTGRNTP